MPAVALAIRLESRRPGLLPAGARRPERPGVPALEVPAACGPTPSADGRPRWASTVDDRVTRVGRFIRLVRIDEIPQVINVLSGDMSFIGPRPERPFFVEQLRELLPNYDLRHRVRPASPAGPRSTIPMARPSRTRSASSPTTSST